jgi:hypothetical protein
VKRGEYSITSSVWVYPEGIESFSPALAMQSPTLGDGAMMPPTLKGLNGVATAAGAGDATPLGLGIILVGDPG